MFKVQIDEDKYEVTFRHFNRNNCGNRHPGTDCYIKEGSKPYWYGVTELHPRDTYNRNVGRKMSLARALKEGNFRKSDRILFWDKYFEVRGKVN